MIYTFRYSGQEKPCIAFCDSEAKRVAAKLRDMGLDYIMIPFPYVYPAKESRAVKTAEIFCRR